MPNPPDVYLHPATPDDQPLAERLWLLFRHDMSELRGVLPQPDGTFRSDRLHSAFGGDADWAPYLVRSGEQPLGLVLVRGLAGPVRVLNSFFVVRGARRSGVGLRIAREVIARHPGPWEIPFQDDNAVAVRFWRRVAADVADAAWAEERRPVPDRPELPPDTWISFDTSSPALHNPSAAKASDCP